MCNKCKVLFIRFLTTEKNIKLDKVFETSLNHINTYLSIHLIGFNHRFQWKIIYKTKHIIPVLMMLIVETIFCYNIFHHLHFAYTFEGKQHKTIVIMIVSQISEFLLRIYYYINKNKLSVINRKIVLLFAKTKKEQIFKLKFHLPLIIFANDTFIIILLLNK